MIRARGLVVAQCASAANLCGIVMISPSMFLVRPAARMKSPKSSTALWIGITTALRSAAAKAAVIPAGDFTWVIGSPMIG